MAVDRHSRTVGGARSATDSRRSESRLRRSSRSSPSRPRTACHACPTGTSAAASTATPTASRSTSRPRRSRERLAHRLRRHQGGVQPLYDARPPLPERGRRTREPDEREPRPMDLGSTQASDAATLAGRRPRDLHLRLHLRGDDTSERSPAAALAARDSVTCPTSRLSRPRSTRPRRGRHQRPSLPNHGSTCRRKPAHRRMSRSQPASRRPRRPHESLCRNPARVAQRDQRLDPPDLLGEIRERLEASGRPPDSRSPLPRTHGASEPRRSRPL